MAAWGGIGLFGVAFLDSFVLSFPLLMDLLVIELSLLNRHRMVYYATMATAGSLCGATALYFLARKGGEKLFSKRAGRRAKRIRRWVDKHAFLSVFIPAILPPPFPFEPFIVAEGVFQAPLRTFLLAILLGRGLRYFAEGLLARRYGDAATHMLVHHKLAFGLAFAAICAGFYLIYRLFDRGDKH
ncbi:MAG TPA: VTT domain-containing protein [Candidatus Acidoferrales bacterium]|nr:VTT domain-containing protein [Candidatus Acidoferrales bacterium]